MIMPLARSPVLLAATLLLLIGLHAAAAQGAAIQSAAGPPPGAAPGGGPDPVVAEVDGRAIHLSEVGNSVRALPGSGGGNAFDTLYPIVLRRLIERVALVNHARGAGLANDPVVLRHMQEATDHVLEDAYLQRVAAQGITEQALLARYDAEISGKPGPAQVHGRAILVATEAEADAVIAKLGGGADFATLARSVSKDATAANGGDLGFVDRDGLAPELAAVLFALKAGAVTPYPVRTPSGWFVLQAEARRDGPTPSFAQAHDRLEGELERERVIPIVQEVLSHAVIRAYSMNGEQMAPDIGEREDGGEPGSSR